jgi:hypothetical protein
LPRHNPTSIMMHRACACRIDVPMPLCTLLGLSCPQTSTGVPKSRARLFRPWQQRAKALRVYRCTLASLLMFRHQRLVVEHLRREVLPTPFLTQTAPQHSWMHRASSAVPTPSTGTRRLQLRVRLRPQDGKNGRRSEVTKERMKEHLPAKRTFEGTYELHNFHKLITKPKVADGGGRVACTRNRTWLLSVAQRSDCFCG